MVFSLFCEQGMSNSHFNPSFSNSPETDTKRAAGLLRQYQANLTSPEEQALKNSVGKVSAILGSQLFQALLGKKNTVKI